MIDALVDATAGHELISFLDVYFGYNQIFMHPENQKKTFFMTEKEIYSYKMMLIEFKNARATYQRLVNKILKEQIGKTMEVYIDDMLVKSIRAKDHLEHLR